MMCEEKQESPKITKEPQHVEAGCKPAQISKDGWTNWMNLLQTIIIHIYSASADCWYLFLVYIMQENYLI